MLRVGLISDTHNYLDPKVKDFFNEVNEIWHAGDIGELAILDDLKKICPNLKAVWGNVDGSSVRRETKEHWIWEVEGHKIWMTHIGGYPKRYPPSIKAMLKEVKPSIFVCGHSHILRVMRDPDFGNMIALNPGAAGQHGWHKVKTLLRFTLDDKKVINLEAIELGNRGEIVKEI